MFKEEDDDLNITMEEFLNVFFKESTTKACNSDEDAKLYESADTLVGNSNIEAWKKICKT